MDPKESPQLPLIDTEVPLSCLMTCLTRLEASRGHWNQFWTVLAHILILPADPVKFLWLEMACTDASHIGLHVI